MLRYNLLSPKYPITDIKGTLINCLYFGEKYPFQKSVNLTLSTYLNGL